MSRLQPLPREAVPGLESVFGIKEATLGFVPNSALTMARWPELARAYGELSMAISAVRHLPEGLSNLVFLVASLAGGCRYCQAHSVGAGIRKGVDPVKLTKVWEFESSPLFTDAERAALRLALAAGATPTTVTDEHFDELKVHFSEAAIVEIVGVVAFSGFMNRWNATMGTTLEAEPREAAERLLADIGWDVGSHG